MERRIDKFGRINIPREMLRRLNISFGSLLECSIQGDAIVLKKSNSCCTFCGKAEKLKDIKGVRVCGPCVEEIKDGVFFDTVFLVD